MLARLPADGDYGVDVLPALLLAALGMSLAYIPATMVGVAGARPEETGLASGLINTTYQVGSAVMVAVAASYQSAEAASPDLLPGFKAAFAGAAVVAAAGALLALVGLRGPTTSHAPAE